MLVLREIRRWLDRKRANRIIIASRTFRHMLVYVQKYSMLVAKKQIRLELNNAEVVTS